MTLIIIKRNKDTRDLKYLMRGEAISMNFVHLKMFKHYQLDNIKQLLDIEELIKF